MSFTVSFAAPSSIIEPSFWEELYRLKLNIFKLGIQDCEIKAYTSASQGSFKDSTNFKRQSFIGLCEQDERERPSSCFVRGSLTNFNTINVSHAIKPSIMFRCDSNRL
jgi:hypothetical protein